MKYRYGLDWFELVDACVPITSSCLPLIEQCLKLGQQEPLVLRNTGLVVSELDAELELTPLQLNQLYDNVMHLNSDGEFRFTTSVPIFNYCNPALKTALISCQKLEDFITCIQQHIMRAFPLHSLHIKKTEGFWYLCIENEYFSHSDDRLLEAMINEHIFCSLVAVLNNTFSSSLGCEMYFEHEPLASEQIYKQFFNLPLHFNTGLCMLAIPVSSLCVVNPWASDILFELNVQKLGETKRSGFLGEVKRVLRRDVSKLLTLSQLAERYKISAATLKRKLKAHGTTYQKILDEVRHDEAYFLHVIMGLSESEVASKLGFFDISNFRRSGKRWF